MKKRRYTIMAGIVAAIVLANILMAYTNYIVINRDRLIWEYMLYDHIQYNGVDYYFAKEPFNSPSKSGEIRGPVYLIYKSLKINYEQCNTAYVFTGYEGEEEEIYLFFDSAMFIRADYLEGLADK